MRRACTALLRTLRDEAQGCTGCAGPAPEHGARWSGSLALKNTGLKKGPGGRSSISGVTTTIFGATGFLGRYVVNAFAQAGTQVVIPYRCDEIDMQHLRQMGDLGQIIQLPDFDVRDEDQIRRAISRSDVVINLLGAQAETWNFSFADVHVDAARRIARIVAESPNCERFVHVSALGASEDAQSARLRTKAVGDKAVLEAYPQVSILKPSYMIGSEDRLYNTIANLGKALPFVPLVDGGDTKVQPVYVRDVADAVMEVLKTRDTCGKTYHLAGPEVVTMQGIVELVFQTMREPHTSMLMPSFAAKAFVFPIHTMLHKRIPMPLSNHFMTADFIDELSRDMLLPEGVPNFSDLGIDPRKVTQGVPIEHIRSYRSGGYDAGATAGTDGA